MFEKINRLTNPQIALIIFIIGLAVFCTGLTNPFQGDDLMQIVNNVPVHSMSHILLFFEGGTTYDGKGLAPLSGGYYRPLMVTFFSLFYALWGAHTTGFHFIQLIICMSSTYLLYLVFRYSFKPTLALALSLIFLVHPINSQVVFAIPSLQDALYVFFGLLAFYFLLRFNSARSLFLVTICIFLSMLSKEMGSVFIILSLLYLFWFNRERLRPFIYIMAPILAIYLAMRVNAVGVSGKSVIAPIDFVSLPVRLMNIPSIILFYISKFIFPWRLATQYYWVVRTFSTSHVIVPLVIDLAVIGCFVYLGNLVRNRLPKSQYYTYLFFAAWAVICLVPYLQIYPLDMTTCENWLYCSMIGILGMVGIALVALKPHINLNYLLVLAIILISALGIRSASRGLDYKTQYTLAAKNIVASPTDYYSFDLMTNESISQGKYKQAEIYAQRSISIFPDNVNYNNLGVVLVHLGGYPAAVKAFDASLKYNKGSIMYENLGELALVYGNYNSDTQIFQTGVTKYPHDSTLWMYLSIFDEIHGNNTGAKIAITKAATYGQVSEQLYYDIYNDLPFTTVLGNTGSSLHVS